MRQEVRHALLGIALLSATACTKAQAKTPAPPPPLATPAPPDRVIVPAPIPEQVDLAPPPQPPATPPARPQTPAPQPQRPAAAPAPAAPVSPPAEPPMILQTTSNPGEVEQRARTLIGAAQRDLDRINPALLSANARAQFDTARGFVRQAEAALKVKNVVLARELADKAAALASQLGR